MENQAIATASNAVATLFNKIKTIDNIVNRATTLNIEAANLQLQAKNERKAAKSAKNNSIVSKIVLFFILLWIISSLVVLAEGIVSEIFHINFPMNSIYWSITNGVGLVITLIVCIPIWCKPSQYKIHIEKAEHCEQESQKKFDSANILVQDHFNELSIIPQKYWYPIATNFLVEVIETGRATTLPLAFDKLEEQIHRWNMEQGMQEQISIQMEQTAALRRIEATTAASAAADIASLFLG